MVYQAGAHLFVDSEEWANSIEAGHVTPVDAPAAVEPAPRKSKPAPVEVAPAPE